MPICIHTICFKEWGRECAMHFRPRCVLYGLFTRFVWADCAWSVDVVWWIARKWLFCLCGIVWKNMMEVGRGGACVPARVALQGRIRRSIPAHNAYIFGMETPLLARVAPQGRIHRSIPRDDT